jgi:hypothetical protein
MAILEHLKEIFAKIKLVLNIGYSRGIITGDSNKQQNIENNYGLAGDGNTIIFNTQAHLTKEEVEKEFLKLEIGDFQDITVEVDNSLREKDISILSYMKNYQFQLKKQLICDDFNEPWIPKVASDLPTREKKKHWQLTPIYQDVVFPFSYFFIEMDGGRYLIPLPKVEYNKAGKTIDKNNPIKRCTITKVQYQLGKVLCDNPCYNTSYDDMLKQCKIEVVG